MRHAVSTKVLATLEATYWTLGASACILLLFLITSAHFATRDAARKFLRINNHPKQRSLIGKYHGSLTSSVGLGKGASFTIFFPAFFGGIKPPSTAVTGMQTHPLCLSFPSCLNSSFLICPGTTSKIS